MILGLIFAVAGLIVLAFAADHFVAGAARLAVFYNVSPVVIGAVLIGFGTSAPEMVVSGIAAGQGDLDIGVGNIIGSNVANISLVLAAAAAVRTIPVARRRCGERCRSRSPRCWCSHCWCKVGSPASRAVCSLP